MAALSQIPTIVMPAAELVPFGQRWQEKQRVPRKSPYSSTQLGYIFDSRVGQAPATLLGGLKVVAPRANAIRPAEDDVVEMLSGMRDFLRTMLTNRK